MSPRNAARSVLPRGCVSNTISGRRGRAYCLPDKFRSFARFGQLRVKVAGRLVALQSLFQFVHLLIDLSMARRGRATRAKVSRRWKGAARLARIHRFTGLGWWHPPTYDAKVKVRVGVRRVKRNCPREVIRRSVDIFPRMMRATQIVPRDYRRLVGAENLLVRVDRVLDVANLHVAVASVYKRVLVVWGQPCRLCETFDRLLELMGFLHDVACGG